MTKDEIEKFSEILAYPTESYAVSLEKLALNVKLALISSSMLSNNEIYEHYKNTFDEELNDHEFKLMNIEKNFTKDDRPMAHETLDTYIEILRNKYKTLKEE